MLFFLFEIWVRGEELNILIINEIVSVFCSVSTIIETFHDFDYNFDYNRNF